MSDAPAVPPAESSRLLLDRVSTPLAYFDTDLRCRLANSAYAAQAGLAADAATGRRLPDLIGEAAFERHRPYVERALAGAPQSFDEDAPGPGAEPRSRRVGYAPARVDGRVDGLVAEVADITAQKTAERALRQSEARFRTLSESSPLGLYFADTDGRRTYTNGRWREIYGLCDDSGLGDGWMAALHEDDRDAVTAAWRAMAAAGTELETSFRVRRGAGRDDVRVLRTRARPVRDEAGAVTGFAGILEDITDRHAAEARLRASERLLDRTGQVARVGGWEVDLRTRQARWSAQTRRICEVAEDHAPSFMGGSRFYPPQAWEQLSAAFEAAIRHGRHWDLELPLITARGRRRWVRVFGEAEVEDGATVRLVGVLQDITEQHRQRAAALEERALRRASEQHAEALDRLLRERGQMLDVLAHEVRQPLNNASAALQGAVSVAQELHGQAAASRLARAQAVLAQVMASIDNTLAVASLLARPELVQLVDADIDTLLQLSVAEILPAHRGRVRIERETTARTVAMDMSLMRLALRNLLSNALRHSAPDAPVTIRVADADDPLGLSIDVENEGEPLSEGQVARLFERGALRAPGDMMPSHGLGLGLYIVRRVMDLHGGTAELLANGAGRVAFRLFLGADG